MCTLSIIFSHRNRPTPGARGDQKLQKRINAGKRVRDSARRPPLLFAPAQVFGVPALNCNQSKEPLYAARTPHCPLTAIRALKRGAELIVVKS